MAQVLGSTSNAGSNVPRSSRVARETRRNAFAPRIATLDRGKAGAGTGTCRSAHRTDRSWFFGSASPACCGAHALATTHMASAIFPQTWVLLWQLQLGLPTHAQCRLTARSHALHDWSEDDVLHDNCLGGRVFRRGLCIYFLTFLLFNSEVPAKKSRPIEIIMKSKIPLNTRYKNIWFC